MKSFADSYALLPDAQQTVARLIATTDAFPHLVDVRIACVASQRIPMLHGAPCQAFICAPAVQGPLHWLFDWFLATLTEPLFDREALDFLLMIDATLWPTLSEVHQERLVFHELRHVVARTDEYGVERRSQQDGRVLLKLQPHDFEFFADEVTRYGPAVCSLELAAIAIADGYRRLELEKEHAA